MEVLVLLGAGGLDIGGPTFMVGGGFNPSMSIPDAGMHAVLDGVGGGVGRGF